MKSEVDLKIVFLGPSSVGKTCLITRYVQNTYKPGTQATVGAGFLSHVLDKNPASKCEQDDSRVTLLLWDTAGEERFKSVAPCLLHGAEGLVIVFSLTEHVSFESIDQYYDMFIDTVPLDENEELPILLLGNKVDLCEDDKKNRAVDEDEIKQWMERHRVTMYAEVSAKTGKGIKDAIENKFVYSILTAHQSQEANMDMLRLPTEQKEKKKKGCC